MWKVEIKNSPHCAWRARYLYVNGQQVARIGIDPCLGDRPVLFGMVANKSFQWNLPKVHWQSNPSPLRRRAYQLSSWFWHQMDGRYGWGKKDPKC